MLSCELFECVNLVSFSLILLFDAIIKRMRNTIFRAGEYQWKTILTWGSRFRIHGDGDRNTCLEFTVTREMLSFDFW